MRPRRRASISIRRWTRSIAQGHEGDHHRRGRRRDRQGPTPAERGFDAAGDPRAEPMRRARADADPRLEPARPDHRARAVALCRAGLAADDRRRHARARGGHRRRSSLAERQSAASRSSGSTPASRGELEALDPTGYDHVLVLGYSDHMAAQPADTRTLVTLLHLRKIAEDGGQARSASSAR